MAGEIMQAKSRSGAQRMTRQVYGDAAAATASSGTRRTNFKNGEEDYFKVFLERDATAI